MKSQAVRMKHRRERKRRKEEPRVPIPPDNRAAKTKRPMMHEGQALETRENLLPADTRKMKGLVRKRRSEATVLLPPPSRKVCITPACSSMCCVLLTESNSHIRPSYRTILLFTTNIRK
jgi:hypothetical protein